MLKASVVGNVGNDPELKYTSGGTALLRFNVASNYRSKNQAGEWEDRTEWLRVAVFGQRAERLGDHLRKGMKVFVDGRLEARPWTTQAGELRAGLELAANDVEFMSARRDEDQGVGAIPSVGKRDDDDDLPF